MNTRPIAVDLFCGVGGMSLGFAEAGFNVIAAFDANANAVAYHEKNFPACRSVVADLSRTSGRELRKLAGIGTRRIDVVFGGPPCQGFSYGGTHKRSDRRNSLIFHFARLVVELQASYFVMENVKGLLAPRHAWRLAEVRRKLRSEGYAMTWPSRVLDASQYGVPQQRKRVFVIGGKGSLPAPDYPAPYPGRPPTVWDAIGDLDPVDEHEQERDGGVYTGPLGTPSAYARSLRDDANERGLSGFVTTAHTVEVVKRFAKTKPGSRESVSRFHRLHPDGVAFTLRAGTGPENGSFMAPRPIHPKRHRCIYPREAARLHSFPDWFEFDETLWHSFRHIGNSVPPRLARAIAEQVGALLCEKECQAV